MVSATLLRAAMLVAMAGMLASCGGSGPSASIRYGKTREHFSESTYGKASPRVTYGRVPKGGGRSMVGAPYRVAGKTYVPRDNPGYSATGLASWYGTAFHGRETANGEVYDVDGLTAAHPTLPLPSYVRVTNLANGRSLIVRVNDRGPFARNRIIDVSARAASMLGFMNTGTAKVQVDYMGPAQMDGRDDKMLLASYRDPRAGRGGAIFDWNGPNNDGGMAVAIAPPRPPPVAVAPRPPTVAVTLDPDAAVAPPMALMPAYTQPSDDDPLAPLIMRASFVNSFAAQPPVTAAQRAATRLAQANDPDLQAALDRAAASKARELRGTSAIGAIVQLGAFGDPNNAARVASDFGQYGQVGTITETIGGRQLRVVSVTLDPSVDPADVIDAAATAGLSGARVITQ